ncbi:MAG TPA: HepT-like ribonuclease domain-containing protein [Stellaceae bacterium]|nr:HepT-like ribonuclease domain-containing protein [Stellaceae bacterium]HTV89356.1 HepT-like ribonuclease domain-containing protein [Stellaceae bacterium]
MRSDDPRGPLLDILENIGLAQQFVATFNYDAFYNDRRTVYAVIRCLEVVSEASRRLPEALKQRRREIPWRDIAAAGNIYRHQYEGVLERRIWRTVQDHLPPLLRAVEDELSRLPDL